MYVLDLMNAVILDGCRKNQQGFVRKGFGCGETVHQFLLAICTEIVYTAIVEIEMSPLKPLILSQNL